jgi:tRNA(Ile)-lysidine synthase
VDSSALFYTLLEKEIAFDIAIVDYNVRSASKDEVAYAKELAQTYKRKIFTKSVKLEGANFEAAARAIRYEFFEQIIKEEGYKVLLLAHHLGDRLEWFFMRLTRGGGAVELCGFERYEKREGYSIARPFFERTKDELLDFLSKEGYRYFVDESNFDDKYERNRFRKNFSEPLLKSHKEGILRSFRMLEVDKEKLLPKEYKKIKSLYILERDENEIRLIAKIAKFFKIVLSAKQREEIERLDECVISGKMAVGKNDESVFIAPALHGVVMPKEFKEECRQAKIPTNVRAYMYSEKINLIDACPH